LSEKKLRKELRIITFDLGIKSFLDIFVSLAALPLREHLLRIRWSAHIYVTKPFLKNVFPNYHCHFQAVYYGSFCNSNKPEKHVPQTVIIMHFNAQQP